MNRKILVATAGALALGVMAVPAAAQTTKPVGLSLRAGIGFPTASGSRRDMLFAVGAEFKVSDANLGMADKSANGHISLSADYLGKSSSYAIPVLLNYVGMNNEFFYSAGAGISFDHSGNGGDNKGNFGYQVGLGYNFQQSQTPVFLEAKYFGSSKSEFNAIGVYLGVRL
jgi:hypothetical protein